METMSIIAGKLKNQKIQLVDDSRTRYTPSKVKNAIFSILESKCSVQNASFLDLCAGCGQMGFEAFSRGASFVTFVDISEKSIKTLKKNVQSLNLSNKVRILKKDVMRFIKNPPEAYDIIFIDPPFNQKLYNRIINKLLSSKNILKPEGRIIVESFKNFSIFENENYNLEDEHFYSAIKIVILNRKG
ncbi:MAG: 16S rRNA (guanine(966)-N(2))-methyltransferase RsmD [Thermotogota bacterium]